jgi:MYXO-CTERM domain-containing protein
MPLPVQHHWRRTSLHRAGAGARVGAGLRGRVFALVASALIFASPSAAHAFCRTTTSPLPSASYDPSTTMKCWAQGTPLAWPSNSVVPYSLAQAASVQVTLADATRVADAAFNTWNTTMCPASLYDDAGAALADASDVPNVQTYDEGPSDATTVANDCGLIQCDPTVHDTHHIIVFRDTEWDHDDPNNTLALTTVTYGVSSGTIYDADMEINAVTTGLTPHYLSAVEPPPANLPRHTYDLQTILTHEAGHFFGLAHATDSSAVMYANYTVGSIALQPDDIAGICTIYPPDPILAIEGESASGHKSSCSSVPGPASPFAPGAALVAGLGLVGWIRRKRAH